MNGEQNDSQSDVAARFGCDGDLLQQTMERVRSGELSPADATEFLLSQRAPLAGSQSSTAKHENLASLLQRLGSPPSDIVDGWCQQMRVAAVAHFNQTGQPLPLIDLNEWTIDPTGQLLWGDRCWAAGTQVNEHDVDPISAERIQRFHDSFACSISPASNAPASTESMSDIADKVASPVLSNEPKSREAKSKRKESPARRLVFGGLIIASIAAIGGILFQASRQGEKPAKGKSSQQSGASGSDIFSASRIDQGVANATTPAVVNTDPVGSGRVAPAQLETFEAAHSDDTVAVDAPLADSGELMSLDGLTPKSDLGDSVAASVAAAEPASELASPTMEAAMPTIGGPAMDPLAEDDGPGPDESPQTTRTSKTRSIQLPNLDEVDVSTMLLASAAKSLKLEFPIELGLKLRSVDVGSEIIDASKDVVIGLIQRNESDIAFSWTTAASKTSSATSLAHGRLKADGNVIYLRPTIEADPWPIDLDRLDVRPTWDLLAPMPPRVTRLSIDFHLPEEIELGWIEQIDSTSPRRARGLAVLTPKDGETVSLGMRFDLRGGRKLSCRVRYAARLGPESPWQAVSRPLLEKFADQLASNAQVTNKQITQMSAMYSQADTDRRRLLRPRRDALNDQSKTLTKVSEAVAELLSLIAKVEAGATLKLRVWVSWIDGEQTLLETESVE